MEFVLIQPDKLNEVWEEVSISLQEICKRQEQDWSEADVFNHIQTGQSALHLVIDDGCVVGVLVTTLSESTFQKAKELHVWIAHNRGNRDIIAAGHALLKEMADSAGAKKITFSSPRVGWAKRYKLVESIYEVQL